VEQTKPGGLIVAPWGTHYSNQNDGQAFKLLAASKLYS
jgi:hypothetical protein